MKKSKNSPIDSITSAMGNTEKLMPSPEYVVSDEEVISKAEFVADVNEKDRDGRTMLMFAALHGRLHVVNYLLARGADLNIADNNGFTPLHFAVQANDTAMVEKLLLCGADANAKDNFGNSPIMKGNFLTPIAIFQLLLDHGADPYQKNNYAMSAADIFGTRDDVAALLKTSTFHE